MVEIVVIADDLTGAADTGIQFRPLFPQTLLMDCSVPVSDDAFPDAEVLAVYTGTRALPAEVAAQRVYGATRRLLGLQNRRVFKKVDSCLRGNLGAETASLVKVLKLDLAFIAPAFPEMGRTTVNGIHRIIELMSRFFFDIRSGIRLFIWIFCYHLRSLSSF